MGNMVESISVLKLSLDSILYIRDDEGKWGSAKCVEGIISNGEGVLVNWRPQGSELTEWKEYHFQTYFDSSEDGYMEQQDYETAHAVSCGYMPIHSYLDCIHEGNRTGESYKETAINMHKGHDIRGRVSQDTYIRYDVVDDELEPVWEHEVLNGVDILTAHCDDCDVWLVGDTDNDGSLAV